MKLIFYHFLHLYFLTLFEVIFYIYYIMPYEKELIYNLFDLDKKYTDTINNTYLDNTYFNDNKCIHYQNELDDSNTKLFNKCIIIRISRNCNKYMDFNSYIYSFISNYF